MNQDAHLANEESAKSEGLANVDSGNDEPVLPAIAENREPSPVRQPGHFIHVIRDADVGPTCLKVHDACTVGSVSVAESRIGTFSQPGPSEHCCRYPNSMWGHYSAHAADFPS